jgi:hypothetical protein
MRKVLARKPVWVCLLVGVLAGPWILSMGGCPPQPPPQPPLTGAFASAAVCVTCHPDVHGEWSATLHASAFQTLEAVGQQENAACQPCHVTGFGQSGGFVNTSTTAALENVQCESCHGPSAAHAANPADLAVRPVVSIASEVCGTCHTTSAYPQFPQWAESKHAVVTPDPAEDFEAGILFTNCGPCHSGDYRFLALLRGETVTNTTLAGVPPEEQHAVECVICHDPHARTGNAFDPDRDRDYQLRYAEVVDTPQSNSVAVLTDENRYNLCGRCHRTRTATWTATQRGPHHSIQANVYIGDMPMPAGQENTPLVQNQSSPHRFVPAQCATCHMTRLPPPTQFSPPISNHAMGVITTACSATGCHPSVAQAEESLTALQTEVQTRLDAIAARLGPLDTWGYSAEGGPPETQQAAIPEVIKKVRFLYDYVRVDGSLGVHNPPYVRSILTEAEDLLTSAGR